MPWLDANGLLPGRGVPGRAAGRGAGVSCADASSAGASGSAGGSGSATGASGSAGAAAFGPGLGAAGASGSATVAPLDSAAAGAAAGAFFAAGFSAGASTVLGGGLGGQQRVAVGLLELHLDGKLDRRGSRLDELAHLLQLVENFLALDAVGLGELVYSGLGHCSPSGPRPLPSARGVDLRPLVGVANSSGSTHRVLMSCCSSPDLSVMCLLRGERGEVRRQRRAVESGGDPEGPAERPTAYREVVARGRGMQVRPSSGPGSCWIGHHGWSAVGVRAGGHPQQLALRDPLTTPDARPNRSGDRCRGRGNRCASH